MCIPWLSPKLEVSKKYSNKKWEYGTRGDGVAVKRLQHPLTAHTTRACPAFYLESSARTYTSQIVPHAPCYWHMQHLGVLCSARRVSDCDTDYQPRQLIYYIIIYSTPPTTLYK